MCVCRVIGEEERAKELDGLTVFEAKTVRTGAKRKREDKGDPADVDGYQVHSTELTLRFSSGRKPWTIVMAF